MKEHTLPLEHKLINALEKILKEERELTLALKQENIQLLHEVNIAIECLADLDNTRTPQEWCDFLISNAEKRVEDEE